MVSIKDVVRSSVKVPEFDKHLKKARGHIGGNNNKDKDNSPKNLNDKNLKILIWICNQNQKKMAHHSNLFY